MRLLEELQMNALPSLQTFLFDGWVLRFSDGYTNRANSINAVYESKEDINYKITKCEELFRNRDLIPTYKITPFIFPQNLDRLLEERGYKEIHNTSVQLLSLQNYKGIVMTSVITKNAFNETWFDYYCTFNGISKKNACINKQMLNNIISDTFYTLLQVESEIIACGMAVIEHDYLGLFDITVSENYRNKGYGTQLMESMLSIGKEHGAKNAYLQVMTNNKPALKLYKRFGFNEEYQYHYRILE